MTGFNVGLVAGIANAYHLHLLPPPITESNLSRLLSWTVALAVASSLCVPLPASAADDEYKLVLQDHKFQPPEVVVPAGRKVKLVIENRDVTPEEFESHALNREKVIAGKTTATIFIGPLKPGRYAFGGEYNEKTAQGVIVVQ